MVEEFAGTLIASIIMLIAFWFSSDILFEEKSRKNIHGIILLIVGSIIITILNMNNLSFLKIIIIFVMLTLFYKSQYGIKMTDSVIGSALIYANVLVSELLVEIILSMIQEMIGLRIITMPGVNIIVPTVISINSVIVLKILKNRYLKLYRKIQDKGTIMASVILSVFMIFVILSGIIPLKELKFGLEMIVVAFLMVGFFSIGLYIVFERIEKEKEIEKYTQLSDYAKINERLLEDYRVNCHENKNHLIIIDNMVPKSNKKVHEYIRSILDHENMNKYYFINELKNIPITELKGFINYKLMEMLNEGINLQINISEQIKRSKLRKLTLKEKDDLYNIIGVLLDNASEASIESKEKEVILEMHKEKSTVVIMIANTYRGEVEIDKISEYGYSSKGRNHGTGLYIVEKIISKNKKFTKETSLMDNYFVQTISVQ